MGEERKTSVGWEDTGERQKRYRQECKRGSVRPKPARSTHCLNSHATTSAALKLLRLRRTLRRPGRSDFEAGTTPEEALFATQVPDAARADFVIAAATAGDS